MTKIKKITAKAIKEYVMYTVGITKNMDNLIQKVDQFTGREKVATLILLFAAISLYLLFLWVAPYYLGKFYGVFILHVIVGALAAVFWALVELD